MLSDKMKLLFAAGIIGMLIVIGGIYWPPALSVSVPTVLVGLVITGLSMAIVVRDIRVNLGKYQAEIKAHSSIRNESLYYFARGILGIGMGFLLSTFLLDNWIQTNIPADLSQASPGLIHQGIIIAQQEFLFAIVGIVILIIGLLIEVIRLELIVRLLKLYPCKMALN